MLSGRPLLDNAVDAAFLVDRPGELAALERAARVRLNVLVSGPAGAGRTTTLHALTRALRASRRRADRVATAYVRVEAATTASAILDAVTGAVTGERAAVSASFEQAFASLAAALAQADPAPLVMVDDVPGLAGHALFGTARDLLWELPVTWVAAARDHQAPVLLLPPADAFFEQRLTLGPLSINQARELVRRRVPDLSTDWVPAVLRATAGTPRAVLDATRALATDAADGDGDGAGLANAYRERAATLAALGRPAAMAAAALESIGAAASSDPALLSQLGWTRARAVQVLGQLEAAGLVTSEQVALGRGRPRKVYRLADPLRG